MLSGAFTQLKFHTKAMVTATPPGFHKKSLRYSPDLLTGCKVGKPHLCPPVSVSSNSLQSTCCLTTKYHKSAPTTNWKRYVHSTTHSTPSKLVCSQHGHNKLPNPA